MAKSCAIILFLFTLVFFAFFPDVVFSITYVLCDSCLPAESGGCPGSFGYAGLCCDGRDLHTWVKTVCPDSRFNWERTYPIVGPTFLIGSDRGFFPASAMYYQTYNHTYCYWDGNLHDDIPYCIDIGGSWMICELTDVVVKYRYDPTGLPCGQDNDGDGYTTYMGDCNDNDPLVYPENGVCCPVPHLTPLTDPLALRLEGGEVIRDMLTTEMQQATVCFEDAVPRVGGTIKINSAYRNQPYQDHLREVWDRYRDLMKYPGSECSVVRNQVTTDFKGHQPMTEKPAKDSPHSKGIAIDATVTLPSGQNVDTLAGSCSLYRRIFLLKGKEPWHYELKK